MRDHVCLSERMSVDFERERERDDIIRKRISLKRNASERMGTDQARCAFWSQSEKMCVAGRTSREKFRRHEVIFTPGRPLLRKRKINFEKQEKVPYFECIFDVAAQSRIWSLLAARNWVRYKCALQTIDCLSRASSFRRLFTSEIGRATRKPTASFKLIDKKNRKLP